MMFGISASSVYKCLHEECSEIRTVFFLPGLPISKESLVSAAAGFSRSSSVLNSLGGCVGAIDGIVLKYWKTIRSTRFCIILGSKRILFNTCAGNC